MNCACMIDKSGQWMLYDSQRIVCSAAVICYADSYLITKILNSVGSLIAYTLHVL